MAGQCPEPRKNTFYNQVQSFFTNTNIEGIKYVLNNLKIDQQTETLSKYERLLRNRSLQSQEIFDLLFPLCSLEMQKQWLVNLIEINPHRAVELINKQVKLNYDKQTILSAFLQKAAQMPMQERKDIYEICDHEKYGSSPDLEDIFGKQIKTALRQEEQSSQLEGLLALERAKQLSARQKRDIARDTLDWLNTLPLERSGQPSSVRSILINWEELTPAVKHKFIEFAFEKLVQRTSGVTNIKLGLEVLVKIKSEIIFDEYPTYFNDLFSLIKSRNPDPLINEIIKGLSQLKPENLDKSRKQEYQFWQDFEKFMKGVKQ